MKLYNFDHGFRKPQAIRVGPFTLRITEQHCENLSLLKRNRSFSETYEENLNPVLRRSSSTHGGFAETTVAECQGEGGRSELFPNNTGVTALFDLVLLLSFLTGRRVYLENEIDGDHRLTPGEWAIEGHTLQRVLPHIWPRLQHLAATGLGDAMYCIVFAPLAPEAIGRGAYANAALDTVCTYWAKVFGKARYENQSIVKKARDKVVNAIDKSLLYQARKLITRVFPKEGASEEETADILARLRGLSSPSALQKMTWFLQALDLFPLQPTEEETSRLRRLNTVRNGIAHGGTIRSDQKLDHEVNLRVAGAILILTGLIAEYYLVREILKIDCAALSRTKFDVQEFFKHGIFRRHQVFTEDFEQYVDRLEFEWISGHASQ